MPNPEFIEETPVTLTEVKEALENMEERDKELSYRANKTKEYLAVFNPASKAKKEELYKKLSGLKLVRLKDAHIVKIIDFLPKTLEELRAVLQAYPVITKKDMESILAVIHKESE